MNTQIIKELEHLWNAILDIKETIAERQLQVGKG